MLTVSSSSPDLKACHPDFRFSKCSKTVLLGASRLSDILCILRVSIIMYGWAIREYSVYALWKKITILSTK